MRHFSIVNKHFGQVPPRAKCDWNTNDRIVNFDQCRYCFETCENLVNVDKSIVLNSITFSPRKYRLRVQGSTNKLFKWENVDYSFLFQTNFEKWFLSIYDVICGKLLQYPKLGEFGDQMKCMLIFTSRMNA